MEELAGQTGKAAGSPLSWLNLVVILGMTLADVIPRGWPAHDALVLAVCVGATILNYKSHLFRCSLLIAVGYLVMWLHPMKAWPGSLLLVPALATGLLDYTRYRRQKRLIGLVRVSAHAP